MPAKVALPPANRAAIEQSLSVGMGRALHIHLTRLTRKGISAEMTVSEDHINRSGRINGGILMSFADVLGAIGTVANLPHHHAGIENQFFCSGRRRKTQGAYRAAAYRPHHDGVADHSKQSGWHQGGDRHADADRHPEKNLINYFLNP